MGIRSMIKGVPLWSRYEFLLQARGLPPANTADRNGFGGDDHMSMASHAIDKWVKSQLMAGAPHFY